MPSPSNIYSRKNILVTGGAGFIGSHLCDELIKKYNVICIDNFSSSKVDNINHLFENPNFEFIKHDISKPINLDELHELDKFKVKFHGLQEIYHLACPTSPKNFNQLRIKTLHTNGLGTINVLELARKYKAKILLASSAVVYGPRYKEALNYTEDYQGYVNFTGPRSCYDEGKRFSETAVITYKDMYNLDTKIARIFRTYGPRLLLFDGHMIPDFVLQALNNRPLIIYGDANFTTSLCYIADIIEGLIKLMKSKEAGPFNFGHYQEYKMNDIAEKILTMTGSQSKIEFKKSLLFMTPLGLPDISLVKEKIGWYPLISLDVGLEKTIEYVKAGQNVLQPLLWKYEKEESE
ncbi:GDP-mannose 4,6-dehydratase [Patescibacteria group bacterium]|nr:GDP-mannose 4,6-dehydratase [Patescibacteria group bacterium]MBU0963416.1 GDP-mannose 4,6-dehydratase [Patescibacteria group bacterium]